MRGSPADCSHVVPLSALIVMSGVVGPLRRDGLSHCYSRFVLLFPWVSLKEHSHSLTLAFEVAAPRRTRNHSSPVISATHSPFISPATCSPSVCTIRGRSSKAHEEPLFTRHFSYAFALHLWGHMLTFCLHHSMPQLNDFEDVLFARRFT